MHPGRVPNGVRLRTGAEQVRRNLKGVVPLFSTGIRQLQGKLSSQQVDSFADDFFLTRISNELLMYQRGPGTGGSADCAGTIGKFLEMNDGTSFAHPGQVAVHCAAEGRDDVGESQSGECHYAVLESRLNLFPRWNGIQALHRLQDLSL